MNRECDYTPHPRKKYTRKLAANQSHDSPEGLLLDRSSSFEPSSQSEAHVNQFSFGTANPQSAAALNTAPTTGDPELDVHLPPECASIVLPQNYMAIRYFRSRASTGLDDTKSPESSGPVLIWSLAQHNPMVLHMVCTLGDRNLRLQDSLASPETQSQPSTALEHYAAAPSLLAACTQNTPAPADLENILGALWLMIVYEQKHGNGCGPDLLAHLRGAASLLQDHVQNLRLTLQYNRHESSQFLFNGTTSISHGRHEIRTYILGKHATHVILSKERRCCSPHPLVATAHVECSIHVAYQPE